METLRKNREGIIKKVITSKTTTDGITLIALVITIIVLLILAGITIGAISGHDSIIEQTGKTAQNAQRESIIEKIKADIYTEKTKKGREITVDELENILKKYGEVTKVTTTEGKTELVLKTTDGNYEISQSEVWK